MAEPLILTNALEVPYGEGDEFISAREEARDYLRSQPGSIGTSPHQATGPAAGSQFVKIAHWARAEDFMAATQSAGFRESAAGLAGCRTLITRTVQVVA